MQREQLRNAAEEGYDHKQQDGQRTPSYVERFREGRGSFEAEAKQFTQTFCGLCGFWVDGQHQCPPVPAQRSAYADNAQSAPQRLTAFCQMCPDSDTVTQVLQSLGFHLVFSMPAEKDGGYMDLPLLPAQFHYEDEVGTRVEFLAGTDTPCLADDADEEDTCGLPPRYPAHVSRFWLTGGARKLAMWRTREALAIRWRLDWLDQREAELAIGEWPCKAAGAAS